jgi:membrane fusion protein, multidrug efflux system
VRNSIFAASLGALLLVSQSACGKPDDAGAATKSDPSASSKGGGSAAAKAGPGGGRGGPPAVVLGPTDVMEVRKGVIEAGIAISGDLKPIEVIMVRSRVEGDIVAVLAREGDRVFRGQLLARFENAVQEGERASAEADRESARADVTNAQWEADQSEELFKAGAIPERDLRAAQQALTAAKARLAATEARLRASNQTAGDTRVLAPTTGVISERTVENGEHVQRGATIFTVVRNDILELEASVPARQANELKVGQPVRFTAGGRQLQGKVARIAPTINAASRTILVYLQVPNKDGELKGNAFATGRVVGRAVNDAIVIPAAAVRQSAKEGETFVYRIENDHVQHALVQVGITDDVAGTAQILEGLAEGDRIIVGNVGALGRGMQVRVVSPEQQMRGGSGGPGGIDRSQGAPSTKSPAPPKGSSGAPPTDNRTKGGAPSAPAAGRPVPTAAKSR